MAIKTPKGNTIVGLDVGKLVRQCMFDRGMNRARLARAMNRNATGMSARIYSSSMQAYLIWELSIALKHNFFADLAHQLDAATEGKLEQQHTELDALKLEYQSLKEERDYLRKAIDMMSPK
jgi:hypothetical protein